MKKEEIIRRCYGGMKERHGVETIILFHVGDSFEAYFDDAETIIPDHGSAPVQDDGGRYTCHQDFRRRLGRM